LCTSVRIPRSATHNPQLVLCTGIPVPHSAIRNGRSAAGEWMALLEEGARSEK